MPGGYYSWRNVNNAFYTVTTDSSATTMFASSRAHYSVSSPREELMDKVVLINAELAYKWEEFELYSDSEGGE